MEECNDIVRDACIDLLVNLRCSQFIDSPYCVPYMNYVMSWPRALPIKTIIIGQNPYPQSIYPTYGAALSYDKAKCQVPPPSVLVIAEDLYNTHGVAKEDTINCFRDLWVMSDCGVIAINESVFSRIIESEKSSNLGPIREAEFQIRALQVLLAQSYFMGQTTFNCIGMGQNAAMMTLILRQWCPNDLMTMRVMTCTNPAALARDLGDSQSLPITFRNSAVSKVLLSIVEEYINMPPKRDDKRNTQNIDALRAHTDKVASAASTVKTEYSSFLERINSVKRAPDGNVSVDDLAASIGGLVHACDAHSAAVTAHSMSFILVAQSMNMHRQNSQPGSAAVSTIGGSSATTSTSIALPLTPARRVARPARVVSSKKAPDASTQPIGQIVEEADQEPAPRSVSSTPIPSGPKRRVIRRSLSRAPSIADTEYTVASENPDAVAQVGSIDSISVVEQVHIRSIGDWFSKTMVNDTTYADMLDTMASEKIIPSAFCREALAYVRNRVQHTAGYDAYTELEDESSDTTRWCKESIKDI